jgi:hypothetical protein
MVPLLTLPARPSSDKSWHPRLASAPVWKILHVPDMRTSLQRVTSTPYTCCQCQHQRVSSIVFNDRLLTGTLSKWRPMACAVKEAYRMNVTIIGLCISGIILSCYLGSANRCIYIYMSGVDIRQPRPLIYRLCRCGTLLQWNSGHLKLRAGQSAGQRPVSLICMQQLL